VIHERVEFGPLCWLKKPACLLADLLTTLQTCRRLHSSTTERLDWTAVRELIGDNLYTQRCKSNRDKEQMLAVVEYYLYDAVSSPSALDNIPTMDELEQCDRDCLLEPQTAAVLDATICHEVFQNAGKVTPIEFSAITDRALEVTIKTILQCVDGLELQIDSDVLSVQFPAVWTAEAKAFNMLLTDVKDVEAISAEDSFTAAEIVTDRVPERWEKLSHAWCPCQSLQVWLATLVRHAKQLITWSERGLLVFWLPGFLFPQRLLEAVRDRDAVHSGISVTNMQIAAEATTMEFVEDIDQSATSGIYVHGCSLRNAQWNRKLSCLQKLGQDTRAHALPIMRVFGLQKSSRISADNQFACPVTAKSRQELMAMRNTGRGSSTELDLFSCSLARGDLTRRDCVLLGVHLACDGAAEVAVLGGASELTLRQVCTEAERTNALEMGILAAKPTDWESVNNDTERSTPLHALCSNPALTSDMLRVAIDAMQSRCDMCFGVQDSTGRTPLHHLCQNPGTDASVLATLAESVKCRRGWQLADIDQKCTPLHLLCGRADITVETLNAAYDYLDKDLWRTEDSTQRKPLHTLLVNISVGKDVLAACCALGCKTGEVTSLLEILAENTQMKLLAQRLGSSTMADTAVAGVLESVVKALRELPSTEISVLGSSRSALWATFLQRNNDPRSTASCLIERFLHVYSVEAEVSMAYAKVADDFHESGGAVTDQMVAACIAGDLGPVKVAWLMNPGLWSDQKGHNPLQCAIDLRKPKWVTVLVDALIIHGSVQHVMGLQINIRSLLDPNNYPESAVRLLQLGGLFPVPMNDHPVDRLPVDSLEYGCADKLNQVNPFATHVRGLELLTEGFKQCTIDDAVRLDERDGQVVNIHPNNREYVDVKWIDGTTTTYIKANRLAVRRVLKKWEELQALSRDATAATTVAVDPMIFAVRNAAKASSDGLLGCLLSSDNTDVFGSEAVQQLINYKWSK